MSETQLSKYVASAASISTSMRAGLKNFRTELQTDAKSILTVDAGESRKVRDRIYDSKGSVITAELDAISAENKAKGRRIGRNDHLSWLSRLGMASGNSVAKEILNKAGVSKADKTQYQVTECSIHFEHPRIELPILDKVTASIYVRLQPDTEQNQEIASDVPTASLQPVLIKAELEPHGSTWAVKETMVSVWPEKSDKPGLDSKVWKTLDTTSK